MQRVIHTIPPFINRQNEPGQHSSHWVASGLSRQARLKRVDWVEKGMAPSHILATRTLAGGAVRSRPLCANNFEGHHGDRA
jgi:hypothetical protein